MRQVTRDTVRAICGLSVREEQQRFVAPNAVSIAQAYFTDAAWFRAIYADDTPVGFAMIEDQPSKPEYYLWRFMIDQRFQSMGFGCAAMRLLVAHVRTRPGATEFLTSVVPERDGPKAFYESLGFVATGEMEEGELMLALPLR